MVKAFIFELQQLLLEAGFEDVVIEAADLTKAPPQVSFKLISKDEMRTVTLHLIDDKTVHIIDDNNDFGTTHAFDTVSELASKLYVHNLQQKFVMPDMRRITGKP
jgi:hypothetical protein